MLKYSFIILGFLLSVSSYSQSIKSYVISSAGAAIMGEDGALYLSIGEPMNTEISDGDIMISQGFLNVTIANSVDTDETLLEEPILAYPNPTSAAMTLDIPEWSGNYQYQLFDLNGKMIKAESLRNSKSEIALSDLQSGIYYMKVVKDASASKTIKIIKH